VRGKLILGAVLVAFAAGYFLLDVGQRARVDRGPRHHRTDFTVYQAAARALRQGTDPYEARNPRGWRYVYPPLLAVLLMPLATWDAPKAALVFYVISLLAYGLALGLLARLPRGRGGPALGWGSVAVGAVVCLGFAHQGFQRGQVTHLLLGLQVAALAALLGRRLLLAGLLLGLAAVLRLTPLLPAGAVALGLLAAALRGGGHAPWLRYAGGLAAGLLLGFVVLPAVALGPTRAEAVTRRWIEVTGQVYGRQVDLAKDYRIDEWRFKNQAPRRVLATWVGWLRGTGFDGERPRLREAGCAGAVDHAAEILGVGLIVLGAVLGLLFLRDPGRPAYVAVYAALVLLPVLVTRYTWPTHYLMALPAVAVASAGARRRWRGLGVGPAVLVLLAGTLLFYAAHARALRIVGQAGCLLLACVLFLVLFLARGLRGRAA
jgi:hypothetical protein